MLWWGVQDRPPLSSAASCYMLHAEMGSQHLEEQLNTQAGSISLEGSLVSEVGWVEVQSRTPGRALSAETSISAGSAFRSSTASCCKLCAFYFCSHCPTCMVSSLGLGAICLPVVPCSLGLM